MFNDIDTEILDAITAPATESELADVQAVIEAGRTGGLDGFNSELGRRFPFMITSTGHNYMFDIYEGWLTAFSAPFLIHVRRALDIDKSDNAQILDVKEKYGTLRVYWGFVRPYAELVTTMYELLSGYYCCHCGKYGAKLTQSGWILALCRSCWEPDRDGNYGTELPLEPLKITSYDEGKTTVSTFPSEPWVEQVKLMSKLSAELCKMFCWVNSSLLYTM